MAVEAASAIVDLSAGMPDGVAPVELLERGKVLWLPQAPFRVEDSEQRLLSVALSDGKAKNIRFDPATGMLGGTSAQGAERDALVRMLARYAKTARELVTRLFPGYSGHLEPRLASFRPVPVEGRASSQRKDDTRLHVDAFASRPNQGRRLLRVFTNVNPRGMPRVWNVGEPFEAFAARFLPRVPAYSPGFAWLLERLHVTKTRRSEYDHIMLKLHDLGKLDAQYQRSAPSSRFEFPAQSTWICFSDQVLHAVLAGQFMMEQTYFLPVPAMADPGTSPLRVLERMRGHALVAAEASG